jgi:hypothetical protein
MSESVFILFMDKVVTEGAPPTDGDGMLFAAFIKDFDIGASHPLSPSASIRGNRMTVVRTGWSGAHRCILPAKGYQKFAGGTIKREIVMKPLRKNVNRRKFSGFIVGLRINRYL